MGLAKQLFPSATVASPDPTNDDLRASSENSTKAAGIREPSPSPRVSPDR
jgi:hypothetical protein